MAVTNQIQQQYLERVTQLYNQVQTWGKDQFDFAIQGDYSVSDTTGDYQANRLAVLRKAAQAGEDEETLVDFFPLGMTFLMGRGVVEVQGPWREEELVYLRADNLLYTERQGTKEPIEKGFEGEGWYWLIFSLTSTQIIPFTKEVFFDLVRQGAGLFEEEMS